MKSVRIIQPKNPLQIQDLEIPELKNNQVLVKVQSAGICHSDLHLLEGGYQGAAGSFMKVEDRGVKFPLTPGHEISGIIEQINNDVSTFKKGDKVTVYPWIGEGMCPACRHGEENLCDTPKTLGVYQDGGYSDHVIVPDHRYLIKIDELDPNSTSSLACSGLTAYTAVKKASLLPGENLVVIGAGGLGLMAVQLAKAITNANVTVIDVNDEKLKEAEKLGADNTINSKNFDPIQKIKDLTQNNGCEALIDFVNNSITSKTAINLLRKRGKYIMVGLFGGSLELNLPLIPLRAFNITGAYTGRYEDLVELIALAKKGKIQSVVSKCYNLENANDALEELKNGKIIGRAVFNP